MKKNYQKPNAFIETFSLSAHISTGSCGAGINNGTIFGKPGFSDPYQCAWGFDMDGNGKIEISNGSDINEVFLFSNASACGDKYFSDPDTALDNSGMEMYCYNSGEDEFRVFSS